MSDEVFISVGNQNIYGWTDVRISRGVERLPSDFDISLTERYPSSITEVVVQPGDACQVYIGSDLVITGYVNRFVPRIDSQSHTIQIAGRSKCQDLVDCAAEWPNNQISGANALSIAQKLAAPYGITVSTDVDVGASIPQKNLLWGQSAYEIIEQVSRYRALLAYDLPDGNLFLSQVGKNSHASGVTEGQNLLSGGIVYSDDERYSEYLVYLQSMDMLSDAGVGGNLLATIKDPGVKRHRRKAFIAEASAGGLDISQRRAKWEAARRIGRSNNLTVEVDSWRDTNGALWTPNQLIPLSLPSLKIMNQKWIIGEVEYQRGPDGTKATLHIMPPDAFNPEPIPWLPIFADVPAISPTSAQ